jgi:hypothetical protein
LQLVPAAAAFSDLWSPLVSTLAQYTPKQRHPELDGLTTILKSVIRIRHILQELLPDFTAKGTIFSDNVALVNFVNGDGQMAKGVRHIEIRQ